MSNPESNSANATEQLLRAAADGDASSVKALLDAGAHINGSNQHNRQTPLIRAAFFGHEEVVQLLLAAGAETQTRDKVGLTALEWSLSRGFFEVAQLLRAAVPTTPVTTSKNEAVPEAEAPDVITRPAPVMQNEPASEPTLAEPTFEPILGEPAGEPILSAPADEPILSAPADEPILTEPAHEPTPSELTDEPILSAPLDEPILSELDDEPMLSEVADEPILSELDDEPILSEPASELFSESLAGPILSEPASELFSESLAGPILTESLAGPILSEPVSETEAGASAREPVLGELAAEPRLGQSATEPTLGESATVPIASEPVAEPTISEPSSEEALVEPATKPILTETAAGPILGEQFSGPVLGELESEVMTPGPEAPGTGSKTDPEAVREQPAIKHCPVCHTTYMPTLSHCTYDSARLVDGPVTRESGPAPKRVQATRKGHALLWVILAIIGVAGISAGYYVVSQRSTEPPSQATIPTPTKVVEPPKVKDAPLVEGEIKGSEINVPDADYPESARRQGLSGSITVYVTVNSKGRVSIIRTSNGPWILRNAARDAGLEAVFTPKEGGRRKGTITYRFEMAHSEAPPATTAPNQVNSAKVKNSPIVEGEIKGSEINLPEADYPEAARSQGLSGSITVAVTVNNEGKVAIRGRPSKGPPLLAKAARAAALKATFKPKVGAYRSGRITYSFGAATSEPSPQPTIANQTNNVEPAETKNSPGVEGEIRGSEVSLLQPEYPEAARKNGLSGSINVAITVNSKGQVITARPSRGAPLLRKAAEVAARRSLFAPKEVARRSGTIKYNFEKPR